jgi:ribosomal protein L30E
MQNKESFIWNIIIFSFNVPTYHKDCVNYYASWSHVTYNQVWQASNSNI